MAQVSEVQKPISVKQGDETKRIRVFALSLNGVTVEVSSLGASITKILLPKADGTGSDDVVLGYKSPLEMHMSGNPPFIGVVVGRVANRIDKGKFSLDSQEYTLAINNDPNHLHGGFQGFSTQIWDTEKVGKSVKCTLLSADGDQGYPGTVLVTATYSLEENTSGNGAALRLDMTGKLKDDKPTPINLAQHTYFNLSKHNDPQGILDHAVTMNCESYTPKDATNIPNRHLYSVKNDPSDPKSSMDLTSKIMMRDAIRAVAISRAGLTEEEASKHLSLPAAERCTPTVAKSGTNCLQPGEPYGFDHNFVVPPAADTGLSRVGSAEHKASNRRMTIFTNAPGVQIYTGNYLDGVNPDPNICKDGATYGQWQGMCFETQHFPDSILSAAEESKFPEFTKGKCVILQPGGPDYQHTVQYCFEQIE